MALQAMGCRVAERSFLRRFEQAGALTWLLAACAGWALLLWLAALLGLGNAVAPTPKIGADVPLPQAKPTSPDRIGPLAQYAEAASRPVFTADRLPRSFMATGPDGNAAMGAQSQSLDFILTGVLISPQVRLAILQPTGGGEAVRVREGASPEGASGWRLVEVQPRRAIFEGSGGESSLDLRVFGDDARSEKAMMSGISPDAGKAAAEAAAAAAQDAADAAPIPISEAARIEAIRKRIEARRAQMRGNTRNTTDSRAPTPLSAPKKQ